MAKEITILVPDGYWWKLSLGLLLLVGAALGYPYYTLYLDRVRAQNQIEEARTQVEAKKILGECKQ